MTKRRKSNPLDGLLNWLSLFPWWAGVTVAVLGYVVLHRFAVPTQLPNFQADRIAQTILQSIIEGLANAGQYVVPMIGLIASAISLLRRKHCASLITDAAQADSVHALEDISWREFELLVGEAFRLQGYRVTETGGGGPDGGVDLALTQGSERFLVQCKQWKAFKVGVDVVRELFGVMAAKGATGGFVITSGRFTAEAKEFAEGRNIKLMDGPMLFEMIKQVRQPNAVASRLRPIDNSALRSANVDPTCPRCGAGMVKRAARRGANAGDEFWGCSTFPSCRGTRQDK